MKSQFFKAIIITIFCSAWIHADSFSQPKNDEKINLSFTAIDGRKTDIASLRGKLILIDCWATWCGPCIKELPHIKELYEKYHDMGFEVIGISMDENSAKERVMQIIKKNNITWPQSFEGKSMSENSFGKLYNIKSLPTVYLVDKEGRLVDNNARGERLEPLIKQFLGL